MRRVPLAQTLCRPTSCYSLDAVVRKSYDVGLKRSSRPARTLSAGHRSQPLAPHCVQAPTRRSPLCSVLN